MQVVDFWRLFVRSLSCNDRQKRITTDGGTMSIQDNTLAEEYYL
jgi:hypothetical protein